MIGADVAVRPQVWSLRGGTALTHVVSTRFSLGQGNQTALVEARLQLLFSLCVPTMVQQPVSYTHLTLPTILLV